MYMYTEEINAHWKKKILPILPIKIASLLQFADNAFPIEEIRIRAGRPLQLVGSNCDRLIYAPGGRAAANMQDCADIFTRICNFSIYAWEDEIKNGFITIAGGCRVGIGGNAVRSENGMIKGMREISSINFRIARECIGAADNLIRALCDETGKAYSTLIISPPGQGKTTMLRDIARQLANGLHGTHPHKICIIDERMELCGSISGEPQFDIGIRADIISACSKPTGIKMAIRTLSPDIIVTDELGTEEDANAVFEAAFCGVSMIASAHATSLETLKNRGNLYRLIENGAIERIVELCKKDGRTGVVKGIWDQNFQPVMRRLDYA